MSYFVSPNPFYLFKCKLLQSNYLGWGKENFFGTRLPVILCIFVRRGFRFP